MATSASFKVTRSFSAVVENTKISFGKLYLRKAFAGPNQNQSKIIEGDAATEFGLTGVNNWAIYDGAGADANLVARAKGMHMNTVDGFKGSTLQVMGATFAEQGEWAIVGGTGEFAMARGIIKRREDGSNDGETQELTIDGFCHMKLPAPVKFGPWGTNKGTPRDITGVPQRLESLTIQIDDGTKGVNTISFSYIDDAGRRLTAGPWGPAVGTNNKIDFGTSEFVTQISGTTWTRGATGFTSLKIVTNVQSYATSDRFLNSFGAYLV